ncbi:hypothetical protein CVT24_011671 [Panaeolus cyanescens]|uniref:Uncharacterized protein n=1 Tax=Panaeolus cyanescens TaxID=181874 RepID=A0A409YH46_9AGAR|nr:hypothetical protein CVT24_011671 [Panaeolus cyanescens]
MSSINTNSVPFPLAPLSSPGAHSVAFPPIEIPVEVNGSLAALPPNVPANSDLIKILHTFMKLLQSQPTLSSRLCRDYYNTIQNLSKCLAELHQRVEAAGHFDFEDDAMFEMAGDCIQICFEIIMLFPNTGAPDAGAVAIFHQYLNQHARHGSTLLPEELQMYADSAYGSSSSASGSDEESDSERPQPHLAPYLNDIYVKKANYSAGLESADIVSLVGEPAHSRRGSVSSISSEVSFIREYLDWNQQMAEFHGQGANITVVTTVEPEPEVQVIEGPHPRDLPVPVGFDAIQYLISHRVPREQILTVPLVQYDHLHGDVAVSGSFYMGDLRRSIDRADLE